MFCFFLFSFLSPAALCAEASQWTAGIKWQYWGLITERRFFCKRLLHHSFWWGKCLHKDLKYLKVFYKQQHDTWNKHVSLYRTKCMQCLQKNSLFSTWSQRNCVSPLMVTSPKTGKYFSARISFFFLLCWKKWWLTVWVANFNYKSHFQINFKDTIEKEVI